jgi:hypothetical protein
MLGGIVYVHRYSLHHSMSWSETSLFGLEIIVRFCPGKFVAALSFLALATGFFWASDTEAASWGGLDTCHNSVLVTFQLVHPYGISVAIALAGDPGTPYRPAAALALNHSLQQEGRRKVSTLMRQFYYSRLTNDTKRCSQIESMPRRMRSAVEAQGFWTFYQRCQALKTALLRAYILIFCISNWYILRSKNASKLTN